MKNNQKVLLRFRLISSLNIILFIVLFLFFTHIDSLHAQTPKTQDSLLQCQKFVQKFYDEYRAKGEKPAKKKTDLTPRDSLIFGPDSPLSPELLELLKADLIAAQNNPGEIVGLDFDPVFNSQDVFDKYLAEKAELKNENCLISIHGISQGKKVPEVAVIPEVMFKEGRWIFTNFHYPLPSGKKDDLIQTLQRLKKSRGER